MAGPPPPDGSGGHVGVDDDSRTLFSTGPQGDVARLGIRELRGRLTSLVRRAGGGERIVITIAGRPVAQLGPIEPPVATMTIDDLVARGWLEPARRGDRPSQPDIAVDSWTGRRLDHALREVRGA